MSQPRSTSTWRTMRPSGPVWCVTSGFPRIVRANSAASSADGTRQRHLLRADDDAVLRVAAVDDAADAHELGGALLFRERTGRVEVLQDRLADRGGTDERRVVVVLRARLEAAAARHATRERIG